MNPDDEEPTETRSRGRLSRLASAVTDRVVATIDPDAVIDHIDIDHVIERIDVNRILEIRTSRRRFGGRAFPR